MKTLLISFVTITLPLHAQEPSSKPAALIDPITKIESLSPILPSESKVLEVAPEEVLSSRTVVLADQTITIQKIAPQEITPLPTPTPPPVFTPEQVAARESRRTTISPTRTLMISCTVYDGNKTLIRWSSLDNPPAEPFTAWSNVNFRHLSSLKRFKTNDTTYHVMFVVGDVNTEQMTRLHARRKTTYTPPTIPELPADAKAAPTYIITAGNPTEEDLAPLDALHELYQKHHAEFIAEHQRLQQQNAQRAAALAANPPDPTPDLIIRYWTPEKTLAEKQREQAAQQPSKQGGDQ